MIPKIKNLEFILPFSIILSGFSLWVQRLFGYKNGANSRMNHKPLFSGLLFLLMLILPLSLAGQIDGDYQTRATGNWDDSNSWQVRSGGIWNNCLAGDYPGSGSGAGTVFINSAHSITVNLTPAFSIGAITFSAGNAALSSVVFGGAYTMTVSGAVSYLLPGGTNNSDMTLNIADGTLYCGSVSMISTTNNNRVQSLLIGNGQLVVTGDITMTTATQNLFSFSGNGTASLAGNFIPAAGTFTPGTGTVDYNGNNQNIGLVTYYNLTASNSGTKTLPNSNLVVNGTLNISNSTLAYTNAAARSLTVSGDLTGNGTIDMSPGNRTHSLTLGGANNSIGFLVTAPGIASTVTYNRAGNQTVFPSMNHRNLTISGSGIKTLQSDMSVGGALLINGGTFNLGTAATTISVSGTTTVNSATGGLDFGLLSSKIFTSNGNFVLTAGVLEMSGSSGNILDLKAAGNTGGGTFGICGNSPEVRYSGAAQNVIPLSYCNLTLSGTGTKTMLGAISINGNLVISGSATLYSNTFSISGNATGSFTMGTGTGLTLGNTTNATPVLFPSAFSTSNISLDPASTVTYQAQANQNISNVPQYGNLVIATNATTKTCDGNLTVNGNLSVNNTAVFSAGISASTWNIAGTTSVTGTIDFGTASVKNLTIGGNLSGGGTINMTGAGLSHSLTLNGATNSITTFNTTPGSGSTVNYNRAGAQQVFVTANYQNLSISGSGTKTFNASAVAIVVNGNLIVNGATLSFDGGGNRVLNVLGDLSGNGTIDMSTGLRAHSMNLSGASNLIGTLTTSATASTITYNRAGDQTVFGSPNYRNLAISGGGLKSLLEAVGINNTLTLTSGVLALGNYDLTILNTTPIAGAPFSATNMIETIGLGHLIRSANATNQSFNLIYPVGSGVFYNQLTVSGLPVFAAAPRIFSVRAVPGNPGILTNAINKSWEISTTGINTSGTNVLTFLYNAGEVVGDALAFQPYTNVSSSWTLATGPSIPGTNPATSTGSLLLTGSWTVGSPSTFYSYQSGNWEDASTWTFDPGGTTGPGTMVPGQNDKVVILSGRTVTLQNDNFTQNLDITILNGAILDQSTYRFSNNLSALRGAGTLRLASASFPTATLNTFVTTDGGTTEYAYNGPASSVQAVYYNLSVRTSGIVTMVSDITLNGNLSVKQGTFQINDATSRRLKLIIAGNLTVDAGCSITVGTGGTNSQVSPLGIDGITGLFLNYYELQSHRVQISGDLINDGTIRFSNRTFPVYNQLASNGFVTVYFNGSSDKQLICNGTTDFYNLIVDKGSDQTFKLTVTSSAYGNFRIFGANTAEGSNTLPIVPNSNPNIRKSLWIKNGSLVLQGLIAIPSLSESSSAGVIPGDFFIPANGALILDGPGVIVLSTADSFTEVNAAYGLTGGSDAAYGINLTGGFSGLSVLGKLQVINGYLSTRESGGLQYWSYASGQIILNAGKIDTKQFHNPEGGASGFVSYLQSGGNMVIRGRMKNNISYAAPADLINATINTSRTANSIDANGLIGSFSINSNASNGFSMTGGNLSIYDVCNATATPLALYIGSPSANFNVTGGNIEILPTTGTVLPDADYLINTAGPLYNLLINRVSGTSQVQLNTSPIVIKNNLNLQSGSFLANTLDVTVGGNFSISSGTTYTTGNNATIFDGTANQTFTIDIAAPLALFKLTINKPAGSVLNFSGSQKTVNAANDFRLAAATLNDNGNTINVAGNIFNSGVHTGSGSIVLNGTNAQTIDGNGIFNNLELNNTNAIPAPVSLLAPITINGNLTFSQDKIFNIGTHNVKLNSGASIVNGSNLRYIRTAGNAGDGGITKFFSSTGSFTFPLGVVNYTPAVITFNGSPTVLGSITVNPVNFAHPNVTIPSRSLSYFWRVKQSGFDFTGGSANLGFSYAQANVVVGAGISEDEYVAAKFSIPTSSWSKGMANDVDETGNLIGEPGPGSFLENLTSIEGDYTAGDDFPVSPFGTPATFFSRINGVAPGSGLWSDLNTWSADPVLKHTGLPAGTVPGVTDIVIIGGRDSVYLATDIVLPFSTPNLGARSAASLSIEKGSALDIGFNPACTFGMVISHPSGNGNFRLTTSDTDGSVYQFPAGDFSDFNVNKGTTEFYTTNPTIGTIFILPSGVNSYGTLILSPLDESNLALPNTANVTIYGDLICRGETHESWLAMSWNGAYGVILPKTVNVRGNLLLQGGSFVFAFNAAIAQRLIIDGDMIVNPGAGFDLWNASNNIVSIGGNLVNNSDNGLPAPTFGHAGSNVRFRRDAVNVCDVVFFGPNSAAITNNPAISATPNTIFNKVTVNKGTSQATTLSINVTGTLTTPTDNWLTLQNGRLDYIRNNPATDFTISTVSPFTIPSTAGLYINYANAANRDVLISNSNSNNADLILNGKLTLINGNLFVGPKAINVVANNDIEYSVGGSSEIEIMGGTMSVNGQIRRNPSNAAGFLKYTQTSGDLTIRGQNASATNAKFEVVNPGSSLNISGGTITIIRGNGALTTPSNPFGDVYLRPEAGSITGGSLIFSQGAIATQNYFLDATIPINNLTITGAVGQPAVVRILSSALTVNGNTSINANSVLNANNNNVTFNGNFLNTPGLPGYISGSNLTTFSVINGSPFAGAQTITGATAFNNLTVNPDISLTLNNALTVNGNLTISKGTMICQANGVSVKGNIINDASYTDTNVAGSGLILNGTTNQSVSGSGAFSRFELNNAAGARIENNLSFQEDIAITQGILDIKKYLITLGTTSNILGGPFNVTKMITSDGVFSNVGIRKFFNPGAATFLYPLGTNGKYTPAQLTITANSTVGFIRVNNISSRHPAVLDPANSLNYFWEVQSSGISNLSGSIVLNYLQSDVAGDELNYLAARLTIPGSAWSLYSGVSEPGNTITTNYVGSNNLSGEYTAGIAAAFPANVPVYTTNKNGSWTDKTIWDNTGGDPLPCPDGGPNGFIVIVNHDVTIDANYCSAYRTTINGELKVVSPYFGHNLGTVYGNGILHLETGSFPAGVFTSFLSCSGNGTVEYSGSGTYTIIADLYDNIPNLLFTGTGTRVLPNKDLTICNSFIIDGPVVDNSVYNKKLTIQGSIQRLNGTFQSGSGPNATVTFAGTFPQTVGGLSGNFTGTSTLNNFEINNVAGLRVNDAGAIEVKGNLLLTNGLINTSRSRTLTITNSSNNCVIPAGGSLNSFVDGQLEKKISQFDSFTFPIGLYVTGTGSILGNKIRISSTQSGPTLWSAEFKSPNLSSTSFSAPLQGVSEKEYYTIKTTNGSQATLNLNWTPTSDVNPVIAGGMSNIRIARYNAISGFWEQVPTTSAGNNFNGTASSTSLVTLNAYDSITLASITTLKPRAQFTPTGPVCGSAGIPVSFTSPLAIPFDYVLTYTLNGIPQTPVTITSLMLPYNLPTPVPGVYQLTDFTYNSGAGIGVIDATPLSVYASPTISDAGFDQTLCGITTANLAGNPPVTGTGLWSIISGSGGTIITPTIPLSQFIGLNGNAYTLKWTISNGTCTSVDSVNINFTILPDAPSAPASQQFCNSAVVSNLVASPPIGCTVDWYIGPTGGSPLAAGVALISGSTYYAESNGGGGCLSLARTPVLVTINPLPVPGLIGPNSGCINSPGNVYTTESGNSNYAWTVIGGFITAGGLGTNNTATVTWNTSGLQSISVSYRDANGCTAAAPTLYGVTVNNLPVPTLIGPLSPCVTSTGNVYTTEAGMTNYTWFVSGGGVITGGGALNNNSVTITWNTSGPQTVSVGYTDINGCTSSSPALVNVAVTVANTITLTSAIGSDNQTTCINQPITPIQYSTTGATGANFPGLPPGVNGTFAAGIINISGIPTSSGTYNYSVNLTGGCGTVSATGIIVVEDEPVVVITNPPSFCIPGSADITLPAVTAGSDPLLTFTYWNDASASVPMATPTAAPAGTYYIKGTSLTGCFDIMPVVVTGTVPPTGSTTVTNVLCFGGTTGGVDLTVLGGTAPYTYLWSNGATTQDLTNVAAGTYTVTITDANSCTANASGTVTQPAAALSGSTTVTNVLCFGGTTGGVDLTVLGGTAPYTYLWSNGATTQDLTNVAAGIYTVTITDANSCTANASGTVTEPAVLSGSIVTQTDVTCFGGSDGSVTILASGGVSPYQYKIGAGPNQVSGTFNALSQGTYIITVTDANSCTATIPVTINEPPVLNLAVFSQTNVACFGASTGSITVLASGGTAPYLYRLNAGPLQVSSTFSGLAAATYNITVEDNNGCSDIISVTITQPPTSVSGFISAQTNATCFGDSDGSVTVSGNGGIPPYLYSLDGGPDQVSGTFTGLAAGPYTVTITDANLCTFNVNILITEPAPLIGSVVSQTNVLCFGGATGSITISGAGGTSPFMYQLDGGGFQVSGTFNGLIAGPHTVVVRDAKLCTTSVNFTITQPAAALSGSTTVTNVLCFGGTTGGVDLTVLGGTAPYTYLWSNGATTQDLTNVAAGTYTVTITDANSCTANASGTVTQPAAALSGSTTVTNVLCFGGTTGGVDLTVLGGTAPYTYLWSNGATTQDLTNVAAGTYTVTITDANSCTANASGTVTQPAAALSGSTTVTNVLCFGGTTGGVDLTVLGGTAPYTYLWSNGATTQDLINVAAGTYTVTITDANSCTANASGTVTQPAAALSGSTTVTNVLCFGGTTGGVDLTVLGGTAPYTYLWSNGATTQDLTNVAAGIYTVTITDANSCTANASGTVTQPAAALSGSTTVTNVLCFGGTTGGVDLTVLGGTAPYTYLWSNGATTQDLTNVAAGTYTVTITDVNSCTANASGTVTEPVALTGSITSQTDVLCFGGNTGSLTVTAGGGTPGYQYRLGLGAYQPSGTFSGLTAGPYTITIQDANNCTLTINATIIQPAAALSAIVGAQTNVLCFGDATGSVTVSASGGTIPYSYSINGGVYQPTDTFTGLLAGIHNITVRDANNCLFSFPVTITQPISALSGSVVSQTNVLCNGAATGSVTINGSGGTLPYQYSLNAGPYQPLGTFNGLAAGIHTITIRDANSCLFNVLVNITQPASALTVGTSKTDVLCFGASTGTATALPAGGVAPYSYSWATIPVQTTSTAVGLSANTYNVTVTDANGCTTVASVIISQPASALSATTVISPVSCAGGNDGGINVTVSGGIAPYTYLWSNGAITEDITGVTAGVYTLTITDANGCTLLSGGTVTEPLLLSGSVLTSDVLCFGGLTGGVDLTVSGGTGPYTYLWSNGAITEDLTNVAAGAYSVTITDANLCTAVASGTVNEPALLSGSTVVTDVLCFGGLTGGVDLTVSGGTGPYTYLWSNGAITEDLINVAAGAYSVTITDANLCTAVASGTVNEPALLSGSTVVTDVLCFGGLTGGVDLTVSGGTGPYTYLWSNGAITEDLINVAAGAYSVTITDANLCTAVASGTVNEPALLSGSTVVTDVLCFGGLTGGVDLTVSGGTGPYTYLWSNGAITEDLTNVAAGAYSVTITDANLCTAVASGTVNEPALLSGSTVVTDVLCFGGLTGGVDLTVSGGTGPYTYLWSNGAITEDLINVAAGAYSVTITDANLCTAVASGTVNEPALLSGSTVVTDVLCFGGLTGGVDLTISGGTGPYTYLWSNGAITEDLTNVSAGAYLVTITDANLCTAVASGTINEPALLSGSTVVTDVLCFGGLTGGVDLTVSGGTGPYTYLWSNGAITEDLTNVAAGAYSVTITDANLCTAVTSGTVNEPATALSGSITSQTDVTVFGGNDGSVTVTGAGGTGLYMYKLDAGAYQASGTFSGLIAGSYTVTIQDANLCTFDVPVTILQPSVPLSGSVISQTDVLCFGGATGSVTVTGVDGILPYEYSLNGGAYQASGIFNSLSAGSHTVTVRDALLSTFDIAVTINGPAAALTVSTVQTDVLCSGTATGSATATAAGGTAPYTYSWNTTPAQLSATATGLTAGSYAVTVTDANGCIAGANVTITQPAPLTVTTNFTAVLCNGGSTGTATAAPAGGVGPYSYSWNTTPVQTGATAINLIAGAYSVVVTDANGCTVTGNITITQPQPLSISLTPTEAKCPDTNDGSIDTEITGGTAPYTVIWSDGVTSQNRTDIPAGTYSIVVTDANGCAASDNTEVTVEGSFECLSIPGVITPDPADGFNDEWVITNIDIYPDAEVRVFTRWGKMIFKTKNISANPWDGRYSNGKLVPTDSYHYILYLGDGSEPRSGVISVIRK